MRSFPGFCLLLFASAVFFVDCSNHPVRRSRNIVYDEQHHLALDVYAPRNTIKQQQVLVFIHGGNWRSGRKGLYGFFGKGFARKGVVTVIVDYRLSAVTDYKGMGSDCARAVKWVKNNISAYGGDSSKIYISGHSAGGHLAALVASDGKYFKEEGIQSPVKGIILIDAFGLDMYAYLSGSHSKLDSIYYPVFTRDPAAWKAGSPYFYLRKGLPPFLLFVGSKTFPAIKRDNGAFSKALDANEIPNTFILVKGKRHIPMIGRFYKPRSKGYSDILGFMKK